MNLTESAREWVLQNLPYDRTDQSLTSYLEGLDAHELLTIYHNWMRRLIQPRPRKVHKSQVFERNPTVAARRAELDSLIRDIEAGNDLRKHLSRGVETAVQIPRSKLNRRRDLDLMLNDWGVHHLHISSHVEPDGYVTRDGPLLFAIFRPDEAYLIDVMGHGDWTRDHVMEVVVKEWPGRGLVHEIKAPPGMKILGLATPISEEGRGKLRDVAVNTMIEINGRVFMPRGGMVTTGRTIEGSLAAGRLLSTLETFESAYKANRDVLALLFEQNGLRLPDEPDFTFDIREDGYGVIEQKTKTWIPVQILDS